VMKAALPYPPYSSGVPVPSVSVTPIVGHSFDVPAVGSSIIAAADVAKCSTYRYRRPRGIRSLGVALEARSFGAETFFRK